MEDSGAYEDVYTDKVIRQWWLNLNEIDRRMRVRLYFHEGNSEAINTLYGIMPEELAEIYEKFNTKLLSIEEEAESYYKENIKTEHNIIEEDLLYERGKKAGFIDGAKSSSARRYWKEYEQTLTQQTLNINSHE